MKRMMFLLAALAVCGFVLLGGCKKEKKADPAADETKTEEPAAEEPAAEEPKAEEPKAEEPAASGDSVGVPECDEYIGKYTKCVADKIPAAQKALMEKSLATMKDAWKQAAATEAGKKGLAIACKTALDTAKKSMAAFKCDW